jgi:muramoyltetrapeptide carboxypeptidase
LRPGATIGVAAVSGPADEGALDHGLAYLRGRGYQIREASNLRFRKGFLAGTDAERAQGYRELVRDPRVDAIFFARGGYGSSRILARLDTEELRANAKIHLGGSDLTALFAFAQRHANLVTFYGPMVAVELAGGGAPLDWEDVLRGDPPAPHAIAPENVLTGGRAEGPLVGGCLSILASLCGTPEEIRGEGAILFWEDTGEDTYRLDRMLTQLERSESLRRAARHGHRLGRAAPRPGERRDRGAYLRERFAGAGFPVAMGLACGHRESPRTLPLGSPRFWIATTGGSSPFRTVVQ